MIVLTLDKNGRVRKEEKVVQDVKLAVQKLRKRKEVVTVFHARHLGWVIFCLPKDSGGCTTEPMNLPKNKKSS